MIPILRLQDLLIVTVPSAVTDDEFAALANDLTEQAGTLRARRVIIDVSAIEVLDSFACRMLQSISQMTQLRGADTVVVGIQPEVAFAMVQLGLDLDGVATAHDLDDALAVPAADGAR